MSTTLNGGDQHHASSSKAPESDAGNLGFQPQNKMAVKPPKQEDLQRSYATIVAQDTGNHGWYGSMGTYSDALFETERF